MKYFLSYFNLQKFWRSSELTQVLLTVFWKTIIRKKNIQSALPQNTRRVCLYASNDIYKYFHISFALFILQIYTQIENCEES